MSVVEWFKTPGCGPGDHGFKSHRSLLEGICLYRNGGKRKMAEVQHKCPYCEAPMDPPDPGHTGASCPACGWWCSIWRVKSVLGYYKYPLPFADYFAAFGKDEHGNDLHSPPLEETCLS